MALTVTFDELELNAVRAALALRQHHLGVKLVDLDEGEDKETVRAALRQSIRAQEKITDLIYAQSDEGNHYAFPVGA